MNRIPFLERVQCGLERFPPAGPVLLACSGGGDSIALLHALVRLGYPVAVAHLDHAFREDSSRDAHFVRNVARSLGVEAVVERHRVADEARELGLSFEAHARDVRYAFLARTAREMGCAVIATGHTASDQAETLLMRILRGTGPSGLAGIPRVGEHHGLPVLRPMLDISRNAVRAWLTAEGLEWREDSTNDEQIALRNRIRLDLLPLLCRKYNPEIETALCRLADTAVQEDALLRQLAREKLNALLDANGRIERQAFRALPVALQRRVVMQWLGRDSDFMETGAMTRFIAGAPTGSRMSLHKGGMAYAGHDFVELDNRAAGDASVVALPVPGETMAGDYTVSARMAAPPANVARDCGPNRQWLACRAPLHLRTRRPGDRMHPLGAPGSRLVSDIMVDRRIPAPHRAQLPLLLCGEEVVWFPGGPVSASAALAPGATEAVLVEVTPCR